MVSMDLSEFGTWQRMTSAQWFLPGMPETDREHRRTLLLVKQLNALGNTDKERSRQLLRELLPAAAEAPGLHTPLNLEFGANLRLGKNVFINFGATILAQAPITLGDDTMVGPNCSFITVGHPVADHEMRRGGWEIALPITVGSNCWFGTGVTVLPGVTIGDDCVLGAGSLITRDVPDKSLVRGGPGRVVRKLDIEDAADGEPSRPDSGLERVDLDGPVEGFSAQD